jgi:hypothetical protein
MKKPMDDHQSWSPTAEATLAFESEEFIIHFPKLNLSFVASEIH